MAKNKINLQIITPARQVLNEVVDSVILKSREGEMCILYEHEPTVTLLACGPLKYKQDGVAHKATVMGGFAEVTEEGVTILTDASERLEEIDVARAQAAKERAQGRMSQSDMDIQRAELALRRALVRIKLGEEIK